MSSLPNDAEMRRNAEWRLTGTHPGTSAVTDPRLKPDADFLVQAYQLGVFPMADPETGRIDWYRPEFRGVIPLDGFHLPRNLRRPSCRDSFTFSSDSAFRAVMSACAEPRPGDSETWISAAMVDSYTSLFEKGRAHSVEAWRDGELVGGLYGVHLGAAFFGESMFCRPDLGGTDASKLCLAHLVGWMRVQGFTLLDAQLWNPHLSQFGCAEISHHAFEPMLQQSLEQEARWGTFDADAAWRAVIG